MQLDHIAVYGISHKSADLKTREKAVLPETVCLQGMGHLGGSGAISEIVIYSTCNRLEFVFRAPDIYKALECIRAFLQARTSLTAGDLETSFYVLYGRAAVKHVLTVAASLDSMIVGEPQILGQVKRAYANAVAARSTGVVLNRLMHKAFFTAKKIISETSLGQNTVSLGHAAVDLAVRLMPSFSEARVLLLGAGEMAAVMAKKISDHNPAHFCVVNRTYTKACRLAAATGAEARPWQELDAALNRADVIFSSVDSVDYIVRRRDLAGRTKPVILIDIGMPRTLEPAINEAENCRLFHLDDLQAIVTQNLFLRRQEANRAGDIIEAETGQYELWLNNLALKPTIQALRANFAAILEAELKKSKVIFADDAAKDRFVNAVVKRFVHHPLAYLKRAGDEVDLNNDMQLEILRQLFNLDF